MSSRRKSVFKGGFGALSSATAAMAGLATVMGGGLARAPVHHVPPPGGHSFRPRGYNPGKRQALAEDNPSSTTKLQRAARNGLELPEPDERAKMRHAWYRREKAKLP